MLTTSKGSDLTAHMCRLIGGFAGRTYHIVGNLMSWLKCMLPVYLCVLKHEARKNKSRKQTKKNQLSLSSKVIARIEMALY